MPILSQTLNGISTMYSIVFTVYLLTLPKNCFAHPQTQIYNAYPQIKTRYCTLYNLQYCIHYIFTHTQKNCFAHPQTQIYKTHPQINTRYCTLYNLLYCIHCIFNPKKTNKMNHESVLYSQIANNKILIHQLVIHLFIHPFILSSLL